MVVVENDRRLEHKRDVLTVFRESFGIFLTFPLHLLDILLLSGGKSGHLSIALTKMTIFFSTLVIGGAGSVMLELYGWESVFYISGVLAVLWAYCMWKCMLKGEGNCSNMTG